MAYNLLNLNNICGLGRFGGKPGAAMPENVITTEPDGEPVTVEPSGEYATYEEAA